MNLRQKYVTPTVIVLGVALMVLIGLFGLRQPDAFVAVRELVFYYQSIKDADNTIPRNDATGTHDAVVDAIFHMRSALASMKRNSSLEELTMSFVRQYPEYRNKRMAVAVAFQDLTTSLNKGNLPTLTIKAQTCSLDFSQKIAAFFADAVMIHFKEEERGLYEKMSAWFESQKNGKQQEEVMRIDRQKAIAIKEVANKCLHVMQTTNCHDRID